MIEHDCCALWIEARDIAQEKGLQMDLTCPLNDKCKGETCVFIDNPKSMKSYIDKFYEKIETQTQSNLVEKDS